MNGSLALAQFSAAPEPVRCRFLTALQADIDRENELSVATVANGVSPRHNGWRPTTQWDDGWKRRARAHRIGETEAGADRQGIEAQKDWLRAVPTEEYVAVIAGVELVRGKALCPLPGHEERTPSFTERRHQRWQCFGCGRKGDVYRFAAEFWDVPLIGAAFLELHAKLIEVLRGN